MKPALEVFFEDYGKKKGVELLNHFFKEVEDDSKKKTYAAIVKLSKSDKFELNSHRYLRGVKLFGKSHNYFPLKLSRSSIHKNYFKDEKHG
jgi:hypothetical protein